MSYYMMSSRIRWTIDPFFSMFRANVREGLHELCPQPQPITDEIGMAPATVTLYHHLGPVLKCHCLHSAKAAVCLTYPVADCKSPAAIHAPLSVLERMLRRRLDGFRPRWLGWTTISSSWTHSAVTGIVTYFTGRFIVGQNVVTCGYPRIFICAEKVLRSGFLMPKRPYGGILCIPTDSFAAKGSINPNWRSALRNSFRYTTH